MKASHGPSGPRDTRRLPTAATARCTADRVFFEAHAQRLLEAARHAQPRRYALGIAGIGGSGKSTLARYLHEACEQAEPGGAAVLAMDGFHLSNAELHRRGLSQFKGSPETFDTGSFLELLQRARAGEVGLPYPIYDRVAHEPAFPQDCRLSGGTRLLIVEGNYLLLDEPPWDRLATLLDECWLIDVAPERAKRWIITRHQRGGRSRADAEGHYERTDRPNAERVLANMQQPRLVVRWPDDTP